MSDKARTRCGTSTTSMASLRMLDERPWTSHDASNRLQSSNGSHDRTQSPPIVSRNGSFSEDGRRLSAISPWDQEIGSSSPSRVREKPEFPGL